MYSKDKRGVTLLEVMVVVVIVGILAAIAIPAYTNYVTRARRADAFNALLTVHAAQEMYKAEWGFFAGALTSLPGCSSSMAGENYTISLTRSDSTHYVATAQPQNKQAGDFWFRIDQDGVEYYSDDNGATWKTDRKWEELR